MSQVHSLECEWMRTDQWRGEECLFIMIMGSRDVWSEAPPVNGSILKSMRKRREQRERRVLCVQCEDRLKWRSIECVRSEWMRRELLGACKLCECYRDHMMQLYHGYYVVLWWLVLMTVHHSFTHSFYRWAANWCWYWLNLMFFLSICCLFCALCALVWMRVVPSEHRHRS